ncbi:MAG TPA: fibronectin type III domain-containing protein [Candidatus Norongarragalinales archaeon]|nr:fibronectin type III domain-containing protein [Candidatus Norongarragalinales archaeon]
MLILLLPLFVGVNAEDPEISTVSAQPVSSTSETIIWHTSIGADSRVDYGITESLGSNSFLNDNVADHSVTLTGLSPATQYYYNVTSCSGNCSIAGPFNFITQSAPSIPAPLINMASINSTVTNESAWIGWTTDIASDSAVHYGISASYGNSNSSTDNSTAHLLFLSGLVPGTAYHYYVSSCNSGNCSNSEDRFFSTAANPTPTPSPIPTPTPAPQTGYCADSDGGKEYYVAGHIITDTAGADDVCESATVLNEYLCNDERTLAGNIRYSCPFGCSEGKCLKETETAPGAGENTTQENEFEQRAGFRTDVLAKNEDGYVSYTITHIFDADFSGEAHFMLPFQFSDYNSGKVKLSPRPVLAKNDGTGKLEAIYEDEFGAGKFILQITSPGKVDSKTMDSFSSPILVESKKLQPTPEVALASTVPQQKSNQTNSSAKAVTGLTSGTGGSSPDSGNWLTPMVQLLLLILGIGAVHYFEGDMHLSTEQTSNILEELEGGPKGKMGS